MVQTVFVDHLACQHMPTVFVPRGILQTTKLRVSYTTLIFDMIPFPRIPFLPIFGVTPQKTNMKLDIR